MSSLVSVTGDRLAHLLSLLLFLLLQCKDICVVILSALVYDSDVRNMCSLAFLFHSSTSGWFVKTVVLALVVIYSHALRNDVSVSDGPHIRWW